MLWPTETPNWVARPLPMAMVPSPVRSAKLARDDVVGDRGQCGQAFLRDPAHDAAAGPALRAGEQDFALDDGESRGNAVNGADPGGDIVVIGERRTGAINADIAVQAEDLGEQFLPETVHHAHHDDERCHAERDADEREDGDDGDEPLAAAGTQVARRDFTLEGIEHQARTFASASATGSSKRSPVARRFSSTRPFAAPRGPTMICQGWPMRSASANLAPARSSRSS